MGIETDLKFSLSYKSSKPQSFSVSLYTRADVLVQLSSHGRRTHHGICCFARCRPKQHWKILDIVKWLSPEMVWMEVRWEGGGGGTSKGLLTGS